MRRLTEPEREPLRLAVEGDGPAFFQAWLEHESLEVWTDESTPPMYSLVPRSLALSLQPGRAPPPSRIGLSLGRWTERGLRWHVAGAAAVAPHRRHHRVVLKEKSASLFLYGRDVLGEGIATFDGRLGPGDVAFTHSQKGEFLGLGRVLRPLPARGRAMESVQDLGWYLREGG